MSFSDTSPIKVLLEDLYRTYHKPEYLVADPLSRVKNYLALEDREIAAFLCANLALGRVGGILNACDSVLRPLGPSLKRSLMNASKQDLEQWFSRFRYRFFGPQSLISLLQALQGLLDEFYTLEACFKSFLKSNTGNPLQGIRGMYSVLSRKRKATWGILVADPYKGGGLKRWNLFLRWMVRSDSVDPGGWTCLEPSNLLVPVDTHIHKWSLSHSFTYRKNITYKTVVEITEAFKNIDPCDPVRFDFALSRQGILPNFLRT